MNLFINKDFYCEKNKELVSILSDVVEAKRFYILRGSLAIALYFKKFYRCYKDIDFYMDCKDMDFWINFFSKKYIVKKCFIPISRSQKMFQLIKDEEHMGHLVFIKDTYDKKNMLKQIYTQRFLDERNDIIEKYSKYIPVTQNERNKALESEEDIITEIKIENTKINILNIKYLKEQKIFAKIYNQDKFASIDNDLEFYFNIKDI
jgi:hypothetical protein